MTGRSFSVSLKSLPACMMHRYSKRPEREKIAHASVQKSQNTSLTRSALNRTSSNCSICYAPSASFWASQLPVSEDPRMEVDIGPPQKRTTAEHHCSLHLYSRGSDGTLVHRLMQNPLTLHNTFLCLHRRRVAQPMTASYLFKSVDGVRHDALISFVRGKHLEWRQACGIYCTEFDERVFFLLLHLGAHDGARQLLAWRGTCTCSLL